MDRPYIDDDGNIQGCDICPFEFKCYDFCKVFAYPLTGTDKCTPITDPKEIEKWHKGFEHNPDTDTHADENTVASDSSDFLEWLDDDDTGGGPADKPVDDGKEW